MPTDLGQLYPDGFDRGAGGELGLLLANKIKYPCCPGRDLGHRDRRGGRCSGYLSAAPSPAAPPLPRKGPASSRRAAMRAMTGTALLHGCLVLTSLHGEVHKRRILLVPKAKFNSLHQTVHPQIHYPISLRLLQNLMKPNETVTPHTRIVFPGSSGGQEVSKEIWIPVKACPRRL